MKRQAAALLASASILALSHTGSLAQSGYFSGFYGFGDSLTDNGRIAREANGYSPTGTIDALRGTRLYEASRWSNAPGYFEQLPGLIGTRYIAGNDFAIGGAQAVHQDPNALLSPTFAWGVPDQINDFTARQGRFGPRDLVLLWIGYNDLSQIGAAAPAQTRTAGVTTILQNNVTALNRLVSLGARELLVLNQQTFRGSNGDLAASFNAQFPSYLAPLSAAGINVHYFDVNSLLTRLRADPTRFGYIAAAANGNCSADPTCAPIGYLNGGAAENQYISVDGVHLTGKTNTYIAAFVSNQLNAPLTVAPQVGLATGAGNAFSTTLLGRLDAYRRVSADAAMTTSQVALPVKAPGGSVPISTWSPVSIFAEGIYARTDSSGLGVDALAFGADFGGLNAGIEYRVTPHLLVGTAFNFLNTTANLTGQLRSQTGFDAFQGGVFASVSYPNFFADGAVTFGATRYNLSRPGVFDTITASTDGNAFTAAGKAGYLFDWGMFKAGPIAGLSYANVRVNGYTELGDPLLTMTVQGQNLEGLTGSAGAQFRAMLPAGSMPLNAFLNVTAEHDFLDQVHIIGSALTSAPAFLISTTLGGSRNDIYGKVAGGFSTEIGRGFNAMVTGSTTFARPDGNDHTLSAGLKYRFGTM